MADISNENQGLSFSLGEAKLVQGPPGEKGESAYEYAVRGGYTGTEEQFEELMASLEEKAADAVNSAGAAATSATDAQTAAEAAAGSAQSALNGGQTAQTAAQEAQEAASGAQEAESQAKSAKTAAQTAQKEALSAQSGAVSAKADAQSAAQRAQDAAQSAQTAAGNADTLASRAQDACEDAETAAQNAASAASAAESSKLAAQAAEIGAQSAGDAAQAAKTAAQTAQGEAQSAQSGAQSAQTAAQSAKNQAESAAQAAESSAQEAQGYAQDAQTAAEDAQEARQAVENLSVQAQTGASGSQAQVTKQVDAAGKVNLIFTIPKGDRRPQGPQGPEGETITGIQRTSGTGAPGTTDTYTITLSGGGTYDFTVYNGANGEGSGDFMADGSVPMSGPLQMGGNGVTGLAEPVAADNAATKGYVDDAASAAAENLSQHQGDKNNPHQVTAAQAGAVPTSRSVNGKTLTEDITLTASDLEAVPTFRRVNGKPMTEDITLTASDIDSEPQGTAASQVAEHNGSAAAHQTLFEAKQDRLTGQQGQIVGFDEEGNAVPQAAPATGVTSFNGRSGAVSPQSGDYTASEVGAAPASRKINGHDLTADITLDAEDVGARPSDWTPSASEIGAVPVSRTVNGKPLAADITLDAEDVGARPSNWTPSASDTGAVPVSRTVNGKPLTGDISLNYSDVGAVPVSRKVNNKALSSDITLAADDVGAVPTSRTVNGKPLSADVTLNANDVGAMDQAAGDARYFRLDTTNIQYCDYFEMVSPSWGVYTDAFNNGIYVYEDTNMVYIFAMGKITLQGNVDMVQYQIRNMAEPTKATDAATKGYVDNLLGNVNSILDSINGEVV